MDFCITSRLSLVGEYNWSVGPGLAYPEVRAAEAGGQYEGLLLLLPCQGLPCIQPGDSGPQPTGQTVRECIYTYVVPGRSKFPQFGGGGSEFGFELRNLQLVESKYIKGQVHTVQCTRVQ